MIKPVLTCLAVFLFIAGVHAQDSFTVRAQRYIDQYHEMAVAEQKRSGIPASVTLAQGVLETEGGMSELACQANNHFGIKCKGDYQGPKFLHDDDRPKECFIKYNCAAESYKDHSDYLKRNARYARLFSYSQTDYAAWAKGLKQCGYATNPLYAQRLIKIIEDFKLQEYTYRALDSTSTHLYAVAFQPQRNGAEPPRPTMTTPESPTKADVREVAMPMQLSASVSMDTPLVTPPVAGEQKKERPGFQGIKKMADSGAIIVLKDDTGGSQKLLPSNKSVLPLAAKLDSPKIIPAAVTGKDSIAAARPVAAKVDSPKVLVTPVSKSDTPKTAIAAQMAPDTAKAQPQAVAGAKADTAKPAPPIVGKAETTKPITPPAAKPDTVQPAATVTANVVNKTDTRYDSGKIITVNGLKAFYAYKGDLLLQYAVKYNIKYARLLEINDLSDAPLPYNMLVYLERKLTSGTHVKHTVKEGEDIFMIAQEEGMVLKRLMALNMLEPGDEPATGVAIELQNGATTKPKLRPAAAPDLTKAPNLSYVKPTDPGSLVAVDHAKPVDTIATAHPRKEISRDRYVTTIHLPADTTIKKDAATAAATPRTDSAIVAKSPVAPKDTAVDELARLKAELDKVVYTDDSKLVPPPQNATKSEPIKISSDLSGPVKEKKPAKQKATAKKAVAGKFYTVKKGENFSSIAKKNGTTAKQLEELNDIDPHDLRPGQKIRVK